MKGALLVGLPRCLVLCLVIWASAACSSASGEPPDAGAAVLRDEVGFVTLEPVGYAIHHQGERTPLKTGRARLFYAFQPADTEPRTKPLAVIFNGGPGAATGILFGFSTARQSLDPHFNGGVAVGDNPASWTRFANLLYVDARGTGYSYGLTEDAEYQDVREAAFGVESFNPFVDAADLVRVLLRFLSAHPEMQARPVVFVAESYGGVRASVALDLLLAHPAYATGASGYEDPALVEEIQEHLSATLEQDRRDDPAAIAEQFGRLALLQPRLSTPHQDQVSGELLEAEGSPLHALAQETGVAYQTCATKPAACDAYENALDFLRAAGRDPYDLRQPDGWTFARFDEIAPRFVEPASFEAAFGVAAGDVLGLDAGARSGAYRVVEAAPAEEALSATLGQLPEWDRYHLMELFGLIGAPFSGPEAEALGIERTGPRWGELFLSDLRHVRTFVTDAPNDVVIYSAALPGALARYDQILAGAEAGDQEIVVRYLDGGEQRMRWLRYPEAGHTVTLHQPEQLAADLEAWLSEE